MSTHTVTMPSGTMRIHKPRCIGTYYIIFCKRDNRRLLANCIDATPSGRPKRMRVQACGDRQGDVLVPGQYEIMEKDPLWED